jgi:P4 family phage/plasmid primase-like protien
MTGAWLEMEPNAGRDAFNEAKAVRGFLKKLPPTRTAKSNWHLFDGKKWCPTEKEKLHPIAVNSIPDQYRTGARAKAIIEHANMQQGLKEGESFRGAAFIDAEGWVCLNVNNGVLKVGPENTELIPHNQGYMFTGCLPVDWVEQAQCPLFMTTLNDVLPVEDHDMLQWFMGHFLYPKITHELFLLCYGEGGTGKSTIAEAIMGTLRDPVVLTNLSMGQICSTGQGSYSLPRLENAMVNVATEVDTIEVEEGSNFKKMVSGEEVTARSIYGIPYTMLTTVKFWFNANTMPKIKNATDAELRRIRTLLFNRKPTSPNIHLKSRLASVEEKNGIFNWMVRGLQMFLSGEPCPETGGGSASVKEKFSISNDPVGYFVKYHCKTSDQVTHKDVFNAAFQDFLEGNGFASRSREHFFRVLYERVPHLKVFRVRAGNAAHREPGYYIQGIALKADHEA